MHPFTNHGSGGVFLRAHPGRVGQYRWFFCRAEMLKLFLGIAASPFIAVAMFSLGLLFAAIHQLALPLLFLWERYLEHRPPKPPRLQK
ncbi:hypothetical protein VLK31_23755 [Variovorax sp. H27-G14]|uniref:hypothetical protein n=1 Tax=Variovorax sp. H27-G14 TaxID=3111914 RepID=UPI0038FC7EC1